MEKMEAHATATADAPFSLTAEVGAGFLFGNSNVSPLGGDYRQHYNHGFAANVKLDYRLDQRWFVGLKYNYFLASEDYRTLDEQPVNDDLHLHYVAPQIGFRRQLGERWCMNYAVGIGCMYYKSRAQVDHTDLDSHKAFLAGHFDLAFDYRLAKGFYMGLTASVNGGRTSKLKQQQGDGPSTTLDLEGWDKIKVMKGEVMLRWRATF